MLACIESLRSQAIICNSSKTQLTKNLNARSYMELEQSEDYEYEEEPVYPTIHDIPNPDHHQGPVEIASPTYDADMLNFLQHSVSDSFYPELVTAIERASKLVCQQDQLGGQHTLISRSAASKLKFLADKYINPAEYVVTNIKDDRQFRSILNDYRMDAANAKVGLRRIDYNSTFISFLSAMENHLKGAKLTRSYGGFERVTQQTQRAELTSTYEHKKPSAPTSGISRLIGKR